MKKTTLQKIIEELEKYGSSKVLFEDVDGYFAVKKCIEIIQRHAKKQKSVKRK